MRPQDQQDEFLSRMESHRGILHKIANSYCRNPAERPDLIQEIVLQLWRSYDRFDDSHQFSTWMYRVALNVAISFHRSETRRTSTTIIAEDSALELAAAARTVESNDDDIRLLYGRIHGLGGLDRALVLLYLEGHRHSTIAEILGVSESNVATKISRIKQDLRRDLNPARSHLNKE